MKGDGEIVEMYPGICGLNSGGHNNLLLSNCCGFLPNCGAVTTVFTKIGLLVCLA
jgi:hypothetical protein